MFLESEMWALPLARELGGEVRDVGRYSLMRASSGSPTGPVVHTCALTGHLDSHSAAPARPGTCVRLILLQSKRWTNCIHEALLV